MKRFLALAIAASTLYACGDAQNDNAAVDDRDEAPISSPAPETEVYTPAEGDVTFRDNKLRVWRENEWKDADDDVTLDNGAVVFRDGRVKKDDKEIELEDGEVVNKTGDFFDRTGHAIEKGWNDVKAGAKEMGKDIEKGAEKAGDKIEGAVDDDNK